MAAKKVKVLYLSSDRGIPYGGTKGASIHIREFLKTLVTKGYEPVIAASRIVSDVENNHEYPVYQLPGFANIDFMNGKEEKNEDKHTIKEASDYYRNDAIGQKIASIYQEHEFSLLYERYSIFSTAGLVFAKNNKIPFILEVNAPLVLEASEFRQLNQLALAKSVEKFLFTTADHIITVSDKLKEYVLGIAPKSQVTTVPNGVSIDNYKINGNKSIEGSDKSTGQFVVGFVGSIKPWHGVDLLIKSFAEIQKKDESIRLCLVGGGQKEYIEQLQELCKSLQVSDKVEFVGAVAHDTIPAHIARLDVVTAPYPKLDNFYFSPLKLFEYMAAGKPIVASEIGQISDLMKHEVNGLLVPAGDIKELSSAIIRLKNDNVLREKISKQALLEASTKHSWESRLSDVEEIFAIAKIKLVEEETKKDHADKI